MLVTDSWLNADRVTGAFVVSRRQVARRLPARLRACSDGRSCRSPVRCHAAGSGSVAFHTLTETVVGEVPFTSRLIR